MGTLATPLKGVAVLPVVRAVDLAGLQGEKGGLPLDLKLSLRGVCYPLPLHGFRVPHG